MHIMVDGDNSNSHDNRNNTKSVDGCIYIYVHMSVKINTFACVHVGHYGCKYIRSDCGFSTQLSPVLFGNFYNTKKAPEEAWRKLWAT